RALAVNPKLVICDEPVSALDVSIQAQILNLFRQLQETLNLTYLFIAHNLNVIKHISDHVAVMYLGKIVEHGTVDQVFYDPIHPYTKALLAAIPDRKSKGRHDILRGEIPSPVNPPPGCRLERRCPLATEECREIDPVLEEFDEGHFAACINVEGSKQKKTVLLQRKASST
ncbi:MAG: ABC transporter ATP-binding protein, partial [Candidatus Tectomicrobia bacterium]|nr:ABC transporter ATP-binding protein [Candidatus Tectomicrobia bacterium]